MTIILAAKYRGGIIVGYDTISFTNINGRSSPAKEPVHKFRQVGDFPVGMGISGNFGKGVFAQLEKFLRVNPDAAQGIREFVLAQKIDSGYPHLCSGQGHNQFIFAVNSGLRVGDNGRHSRTARIYGFAGIGSGYYPEVRNMMSERCSTDPSRGKVIQLIREGVSLAERLNWEDFRRYSHGRTIKGLGITDVRDGQFKVLEFEKVNPYFRRQTF
jgi:hypothetical protein